MQIFVACGFINIETPGGRLRNIHYFIEQNNSE
jgi:hypothetical protein